jgi:hypothetical protein
VERARSRGPFDRAAYLEWAESLMSDPDSETRARIVDRWTLFAHLMLRLQPAASDDFYSVERLGSIDIGVGSALDAKYLLRIRGDTDAPEDDVIVEIKPMGEVAAPCLLQAPAGGMLRILLPTARLGRIKPQVLGYLPWEEGAADESQWWVHSWDFGYQGLEIDDLGSQADLEEIARDVGLQLGRGHCNGIAAPLEDLHRHAQARAFDLTREQVRVLAKELADEIYQSWLRQK